MKHIQLNQEKTSPFETILQFGCGPHFVFNRRDAFELMIKEQGIVFWFRFWLCFCGQPVDNSNKEVQSLKNLRTSVLMSIHNQLLQGSVEEATHYCLYKAVMRLVIPANDANKTEAKVNVPMSRKEFENLVHECSDMAFGAALCEVFYKWLFAKEEPKSNSENYWTIPDKYFIQDFEPGVLDIFLVNKWGQNLVTLLGISLSQIPDWLVKLTSCPLPITMNYDQCLKNTRGIFLQKMGRTLTQRRNSWRKKIEYTDEVLKLSDIFVNLEKEEKVPRYQSCNVVSAERTYRDHSRYKCSYCEKPQSILSKQNICEHCAADDWQDPRFYCSNTCQLEHLFLVHYKEHFGLNLPEVVLKTFQKISFQAPNII